MPKQTAQKPKKPTKPVAKRQLAPPDYRTFRLSKKIHHPTPKIASSFSIFKQSIALVKKRKKLFLGITFVYLVLTLLLVKGFGPGNDLAELKEAVDELFTGGFSQVINSVALFSVLLTNINTTTSDQASAYQSMLLIIVSLVVIWALRQTHSEKAKTKIEIRDAFYKSQYALIPFLLVILVIGLQLLPVSIANYLYNTVIVGGLAVTGVEKFVWLLLIAMIALLSLYMLASSLFALYIVTLPDVRPMQALRSARDLVKNRRWTIMRKIFFLPIVLLLCAAIITIPFIFIAPVVAEWLFLFLSMLGLVLLHSYLYTLYRELL